MATAGTIVASTFAAAMMLAGAAGAAEIKVIGSPGVREIYTHLVPDFEKATGHKVVVDNDTAGALVKRIRDGEAFDVAVITPGAIDDLAKDGKVAGMHYVSGSGDVALDRAAYGGITASNPFPPLPSEFGGQYLGLRFTFYYNPDVNETGIK